MSSEGYRESEQRNCSHDYGITARKGGRPSQLVCSNCAKHVCSVALCERELIKEMNQTVLDKARA